MIGFDLQSENVMEWRKAWDLLSSMIGEEETEDSQAAFESKVRKLDLHVVQHSQPVP